MKGDVARTNGYWLLLLLLPCSQEQEQEPLLACSPEVEPRLGYSLPRGDSFLR